MADRFRGIDTDPGWVRRELADLRALIAQQASARRLVSTVTPLQLDINSLDLPNSWANYLATSVLVPDGYTVATVTLIATTGDSMSGTAADTTQTGAIGAQPYIIGDYELAGPGFSQGKTGGGAVSIQASMTAKVPVTQRVLVLSMYAYANGGTWLSGAGNVHLNGTVIFGRS